MAHVDEYAFARENLKRLVCTLIDIKPVTYKIEVKSHPKGVTIIEEVTPEEMKEILKENKQITDTKYE